MEFDYKELREKINLYFCGNISKKELGEWSKTAYYDILKGNYIVLDKIKIYPFVKKISTFHIENNDIKDEFCCLDEEVRDIQKVLNGEENNSYIINMRIPYSIYRMFPENKFLNEGKRSQYVELKNILYKLLENNNLSKSDINKLIKVSKLQIKKVETIQDLLELYINSFFKNNIEFEGNDLKMYQRYGIYNKERYSKKDIIQKLIDYINFYIGDKDFSICVSFINGKPQIINLN